MSDFAEKISEKLRSQLNQVNDSLEQITKAGKGLVTKVSEQGSAQFKKLVETGEAQQKGGKTLAEQLKESFEDQFNGDIKASVDQLRLAALGLLTKAKTSSEQYFNELVKLGETQTKPAQNKSKTTAASKKSSTTAA